jgi:uncharacterized membrane protein
MAGAEQHVRGQGWARFAGILLLIVGAFNLIEGIVALSEDRLLRPADLVTGDLVMWGSLLVIIGPFQIVVGCLLLRRNGLGVILGIMLAAINVRTHLFVLPAYPAWSLLVIAVDLLVIYGLTVYGDSFD